MTYCLGILVNEGLVLASDSRTNAGVDYVSVYSKMYRFELGPHRIFTIVTSGNLASSQAVIQRIWRDMEAFHPPMSLLSARCIFDAATYLGQVSVEVQNQHSPNLSRSGISGECNFIIGGQIGGQPPEIYLVYAQGNCISPSPLSPFLQIGETKYGKPILDRVIAPETSIENAARAAMVSLDSTIRSNITVGPPIELAVIRTDSFSVTNYLQLGEQDELYRSIKDHWNEGLTKAFDLLPRFPWEIGAEEQQPPMIQQDQPAPMGSFDVQSQQLPQPPMDASEPAWNQQMG